MRHLLIQTSNKKNIQDVMNIKQNNIESSINIDSNDFLNVDDNEISLITDSKHLDGLLVLSNRRDNLSYYSSTVNDDEQRQQFILELLKSEQHQNKNSNSLQLQNENKKRKSEDPLTIVYVWRRDEADSLHEYLKASEVSSIVYHAGTYHVYRFYLLYISFTDYFLCIQR